MIKLTENQILILGRPSFACAKIAKLLIASDVYEDKGKKAEYEQAVYIHWALGLLEKHGDDDWKEKGGDFLQELIEKVEGKSS